MHSVALAWKNLKCRKKQTLRMVVTVALAMCLLVGTTLVEKGVTEFVNYLMKEVPDSRIVVGYDLTPEGAEKIAAYYKQDERVQDVVVSKAVHLFGFFANDTEVAGKELQSDLWIHPYHKGITDYTEYSKELQEWEVIIPRYFNPNLTQGVENPIFHEMEFIDTTDWIGKEVKTEIYCSTLDPYGNITETDEKIGFTLKVVGTYDNIQMCSYENIVYVSAETLSKMDDTALSESAIKSEWGVAQNITLIAKSGDDVADIAEETGMTPLVAGRDESILYVFFINGLKAGAIILFVAALVNIVLTLTEEIRERRSEIALLRAMGYENGRIGMMLLWELLIVIGIVIGVVLVFGGIFEGIANWFINEFVGTLYQQVQITMDFIYIAKVIGAGIVAMLATFAVVYHKMEQINTIEALKEE